MVNIALDIPDVFVLETDPHDLLVYEQCAQRLNFRLRTFTKCDLFVAEVLDKQPELLIYEVECCEDGVTRQSELMQHGLFSSALATAQQISLAVAVRVMEQGATTLIEKPIDLERLEPSVTKALRTAIARREMQRKYERFSLLNESLSARQRSVMQLIVAGYSTKAIAAKLDISTRLVELERAKLLSTFEVGTTPELALRFGEFLTLKRWRSNGNPSSLDDLRKSVESSASGGADVS